MFLGIKMPSFLFFFLLFLHLKGLLFQFRCTCTMTIKTYDTIRYDTIIPWGIIYMQK